MAICMGMGCVGITKLAVGEEFVKEKWCDAVLRPMSVTIGDRSVFRRCSKGKLSLTVKTKATVSSMDSAALGIFDQKGRCGSGGTAVESYETLDEWIRGSVPEIVKNLQEAPLLIEVSATDKSSKHSGTTTLNNTVKKAVERDWPIMKKKWETGQCPFPEGLIFVEELSEDQPDGKGTDGDVHGGDRRRDGSSTKAWGIVVQGRGGGCVPVCYLLETTRVGAGGGLGLWCTHFCLMRVKNFRESVQTQLKNCWLLQVQAQ